MDVSADENLKKNNKKHRLMEYIRNSIAFMEAILFSQQQYQKAVAQAHSSSQSKKTGGSYQYHLADPINFVMKPKTIDIIAVASIAIISALKDTKDETLRYVGEEGNNRGLNEDSISRVKKITALICDRVAKNLMSPKPKLPRPEPQAVKETRQDIQAYIREFQHVVNNPDAYSEEALSLKIIKLQWVLQVLHEKSKNSFASPAECKLALDAVNHYIPTLKQKLSKIEDAYVERQMGLRGNFFSLFNELFRASQQPNPYYQNYNNDPEDEQIEGQIRNG